jgi:hypothetical protein
MSDENSTGQEQVEGGEQQTPLADRRAQLFDGLGQRAEDLARTVEFSAEVHAQMPSHLLNPPDHAERERKLAAAERAAAEAYRAHQVPADKIRDAIRQAGDTGTTT